MAYIDALREERGGFCFDLHARNVALYKDSTIASKLPKALKTGTTIVGVAVEDGVVLCSDTRATLGDLVASKYCLKLHRLADHIWCAGAGTSGDLDNQTKLFESKAKLQNLSTNRKVRLCSIVTQFRQQLFRHGGFLGCAIIIGGIDTVDKPAVYSISPEGSCSSGPYLAMGSGSLNALAYMEANYREGMTLEEAGELARIAVRQGILHDSYSGTMVDMVTLKKSTMKGELTRCVESHATPVGGRIRDIRPPFPQGYTTTLDSNVVELQVVSEEVVEMCD